MEAGTACYHVTDSILHSFLHEKSSFGIVFVQKKTRFEVVQRHGFVRRKATVLDNNKLEGSQRGEGGTTCMSDARAMMAGATRRTAM